MPRFWWLLSAAILPFVSGCTQPSGEQTERKVTTEDVRRDVKQAVETTQTAAEQAKQEFEMRIKTSLADMEVQIAKLQEKGRALKDEAKIRWDEKMADLQAKQQVARQKLDELGTTTGEAWGHLEQGATSAWEDVSEAFQAAAKEFTAGG